MQSNKENIILKAYELLKYSIPLLNQLPRNQRFVFSDRIQNFLSDLLELLVEAYYVAATEKRPVLLQVNLTLEKLRYYIRLGYELGYYNSTRYRELAERLDEIGRMTGGWLKNLP